MQVLVDLKYKSKFYYYIRVDHIRQNDPSTRLMVCCETFMTPIQEILIPKLSRLALILGIVYLAFQSYPIIFIDGHKFSVEQLGLTFIGVNVGLAIAMFTQIFWNK